MEIDLNAFETALDHLNDGWIFEDFSKQFLSAAVGIEFIPVGGTKDKGIDSFDKIFSRKHRETNIYQISTEKTNYLQKIRNTISKLKDNDVDFDALIYVTNRKVLNKERHIDTLQNETKVFIQIWDRGWFTSNVVNYPGCAKAYQWLIKNSFHFLNNPTKTITVGNHDKDPRLFIFLRQQMEKGADSISFLIIDTLILFFLEDTDPDLNKFKSRNEIISYIKLFFKNSELSIDEDILRRLNALCMKPRKIQFHAKANAYCLPYDTRIEIQERNINDIRLKEEFTEQSVGILKKYLTLKDVKVNNIEAILDHLLNKLFYSQGLEFSNFMLHSNSESVVEKELRQVIAETVEEKKVSMNNRESVKEALMFGVREIVYNGSHVQKKFLRSLSNTYILMFLMQWDPKITQYFSSLASNMKVFVGTSVIIPALSEIYLSHHNRRHWSLLKSASVMGIELMVDDVIVEELVQHFYMIKRNYQKYYRENESVYLDDEYNLKLIDDILLRAYFYSKNRGRIDKFDKFLNNFLSPDLKTAKADLISFLSDEFQISYKNDVQLGIEISSAKVDKLIKPLEIDKKNKEVAMTDAKLILKIYGLREKNGESGNLGVFGYQTWWLSKDTSTYRAIRKTFKNEYNVSCYLRPDFLYNYISLAPKSEEVKELYKNLFPSLLGVNLSYHISPEISMEIKCALQEHKDLPSSRKKAILRNLSDRLKTDHRLKNRKQLKAYLDKEFSYNPE
ncbi:hypothetical protein LVD17_22290 [Fulvivirga ulvae]|uniref:hypothetical protein n=1 Tax=Fulvivirga ulvae TaxID=2904245 RepID=UPI001F3A0B6F|nr:hypothetical protein [Fulvivirga ulvae]UII31026.1 hypothetical protein LVD17_22290 [Fulvivirga ulvae]